MTTTLFVGKLPPDVNEKEFRNFFRRFGELRTVSLKYDSAGCFRGFGFVTFADPNVARHVLNFTGSSSRRLIMRGHRCEIKNGRNNDPREIFIGCLPIDITKQEFFNIFQKFGTIINFRFAKHKKYGLVTFEDSQVAQALLRMRDNSVDIDDNDCDDKVGDIVIGGHQIGVRPYDDRTTANTSSKNNYYRPSNGTQNEKCSNNANPQKRSLPSPSSSSSDKDVDDATMSTPNSKKARFSEKDSVTSSLVSPHPVELPSSHETEISHEEEVKNLSSSSSSTSLVASDCLDLREGNSDEKKESIKDINRLLTDENYSEATSSSSIAAPHSKISDAESGSVSNEESIYVHVGNIPKHLSKAHIIDILRDRYRDIYGKELLTAIQGFVIRQHQSDALIKCNSKKDAEDLMYFDQERRIVIRRNVFKFILCSKNLGYDLVFGFDDFFDNSLQPLSASSSPSPPLPPLPPLQPSPPSVPSPFLVNNSNGTNDDKYRLLEEKHEALKTDYDNAKQRNEELESEYDTLNANMMMTIKELKRKLHESERRRYNLSDTVSEQTKAIETMTKVQNDYRQRLNDEIEIRNQVEVIFEDERKELSKLLEDEVERRCNIECDRKNLRIQLDDEMKKSQQVFYTYQQLLMEKEQNQFFYQQNQQPIKKEDYQQKQQPIKKEED